MTHEHGSYEQLPTLDPASRLLELRKQHGTLMAIPQGMLREIGFIRGYDQDSNIVLRSIEEVEAEKAAYAPAKPREALVKKEAPFEDLTIQIESSKGYGTGLTGNVLSYKIEDGISTFIHDSYSEDSAAWIDQDNALTEFQILNGMDNGNTIHVSSDGEGKYIENFGASDATIAFVETILFEDSIIPIAIGDTDPVAVRKFITDGLDTEAVTRVKTDVAQTLSERLSRLQARLADVPELEKVFERILSSGINGDLDEFYEADEIADMLSNAPTLQTDRNPNGLSPLAIRISSYGMGLKSAGFEDVADGLKIISTLKEARSFIEKSLRGNAKLNSFKQAEKELRIKRASMDNDQDIWEYNRQLQQLKSEAKAAMRPLRGLHDFLNLPTRYASAVTSTIKDMQRNLVRNTSAETFAVTLKSEYDPVRDTDPGAVSGDCTEGNSLPFDTHIPLHNVKIFEGDAHKGNIYLLETTTEDGRSAWHLDAIQYPNLRVNWDTFPKTLIATLSAEAEKKGIEVITVNKRAHEISNYDYIARGFLNYIGATGTEEVEYDQLEIPHYESEPELPKEIEEVELNFAPPQEGYSQLQGAGSEQLVIWKPSKTR